MLIVDMPMPQSCPCDLIGVGYDLYCFGVDGVPARVKEYYECAENGTRPDWCPIKGELVRCGECIMGFEENGEKYCGGEWHKLDWFCADSERKGGEHEETV